MIIDTVTITGADDTTSIDWMLEVSRSFPRVEWGILVSASQTGTPRFPSDSWLHSLAKVAKQNEDLRLSMHVCGRWVREICQGHWTEFLKAHMELPCTFDRVQLNFHAYTHQLAPNFFPMAESACRTICRQLIFQLDGVNDSLLTQAKEAGINAVPLFDKSGGAGVSPDSWPIALPDTLCGYAGGLSPDNLDEELARINKVTQADSHIWIDTETKVRTSNNLELDKDAVLSFVSRAPYAFDNTCKVVTCVNGVTSNFDVDGENVRQYIADFEKSAGPNDYAYVVGRDLRTANTPFYAVS